MNFQKFLLFLRKIKKKLNTNIFFLVDPLDGTKEFIAKNDEFTVNIALMVKNKPILGVVQIPAKSTQYFSDGFDSFKYQKTSKKILSFNNNDKTKIVVSRSHLDLETKNFIKNNKDVIIKKAGSSLKFCLISEGKADLYIRNGITMGWDIAAGMSILKTAGAKICKFNLEEFKINSKTFINEPLYALEKNMILVNLN